MDLRITLNEEQSSLIVKAVHDEILKKIKLEETPKWLNTRKTCDYLGCSTATLYRYFEMGLRYTAIGSKRYVEREELDKWIGSYKVVRS